MKDCLDQMWGLSRNDLHGSFKVSTCLPISLKPLANVFSLAYIACDHILMPQMAWQCLTVLCRQPCGHCHSKLINTRSKIINR